MIKGPLLELDGLSTHYVSARGTRISAAISPERSPPFRRRRVEGSLLAAGVRFAALYLGAA